MEPRSAFDRARARFLEGILSEERAIAARRRFRAKSRTEGCSERPSLLAIAQKRERAFPIEQDVSRGGVGPEGLSRAHGAARAMSFGMRAAEVAHEVSSTAPRNPRRRP
jgi:hypothetical protein